MTPLRNNIYMFRTLSLILIIWYLSTLFTSSFKALDQTATAIFETVGVAARVTSENFDD